MPFATAAACQHDLAGLIALPESARLIAQWGCEGHMLGFIQHDGGLRAGNPDRSCLEHKQTLCQIEEPRRRLDIIIGPGNAVAWRLSSVTNHKKSPGLRRGFRSCVETAGRLRNPV